MDTKNVTLANGMEKQFQFTVIGNPCDDPSQLEVPFMQHEGMTSIADSAREVRCLDDGILEGATLSDHGYIIIGMFFDSEDAISHGVDGIVAGATDEIGDPTPGRMSTVLNADVSGRKQYHDEREYLPMCEDRARKGYNSGMGEIFRKVCAVSPIGNKALAFEDSDEGVCTTCELDMKG